MTGQRHDLDLLEGDELVRVVLVAQECVLPTVLASSRAIAAAAELVADRMERGGRLVLAGAGTSGRIAFLEAAELPGTFGVAPDSVVALVAGGPAARDTAEDDLAGAADDLARVGLRGEDALVAVAASGTTPYTLALAEAARAVGSAVVAVVAVGGSPLQAFADVAVVADVGPEVLRGSTRLGAGTAQKLVLDALTTAVMVRLGHVHGDLMIDVVAANEKLRERAAAVVAEIAGCPPEAARTALDACGGDARAAAVHLLTGRPPAEAMEHARSRRTLRAALES